MRVASEIIPDGDEGTGIVLERMAELVQTRIAHPVVRGKAVALARRVAPHHVSGQIAAIRGYLVRRVRFVADPLGPELLQDPVLMLEDAEREGAAMGDCDDFATLAASLGGAIGIPARFVVVGFSGPDAPYEHVWTELFDGSQWHELDVTRPRHDAEAPAVERRVFVDVTTGEATMHGYSDEYSAVPEWPHELPRTVRLGAVPQVAATALKITTFVSAILPFFGSSKDPERNQATDAAYALAIQGNEIALLFLRQRTGDYGVVEVPGVGQVGGWGSGAAKAYARQKYQAALSALAAGPVPPIPPIPGEPGVPVATAGVSAGDGLAKWLPAAIGIGIAFAVLSGGRPGSRR